MTQPPVLTGSRVILRPPRAEDAEARRALGIDPDIVRMFGGTVSEPGAMTEEEAETWLDHLRLQEPGWVMEAGGRVIGAAFLHGVSHQDRRAKLALGILDPALLGQGLGREAIRLVLGHAFGTMDLHRVELRILAFNERAIRCYRACGFVEEGRERESACVGGEWHDDVIMGILAREFTGRPDNRG